MNCQYRMACVVIASVLGGILVGVPRSKFGDAEFQAQDNGAAHDKFHPRIFSCAAQFLHGLVGRDPNGGVWLLRSRVRPRLHGSYQNGAWLHCLHRRYTVTNFGTGKRVSKRDRGGCGVSFVRHCFGCFYGVFFARCDYALCYTSYSVVELYLRERMLALQEILYQRTNCRRGRQDRPAHTLHLLWTIIYSSLPSRITCAVGIMCPFATKLSDN